MRPQRMIAQEDTVYMVSPPAPFITVIIAAYRAAAFINRALASVQAQTYSNWEVVVVDDASPDGTREVVQAVADLDPRIRLLTSSENGGPSAARNRAIASARGEWVAVLDADDAWSPVRLERLVRQIDNEPCDVVADNLIFFDDQMGRAVGLAMAPERAPRRLSAREVLLSERPWPGFRLGFLKPLYRVAFLQERRLAYQPEYRYAEDFMMLMEVLLSGARGWLVLDPMYIYTIQINSLKATKSTTSQSKYDGNQRLGIAMDLHAKFHGSAGTSDARALECYVRWMRDLRDGQDLITALRKRSLASLKSVRRVSIAAAGCYLLTTPTFKRWVQKSLNLGHGRSGEEGLRPRIM